MILILILCCKTGGRLWENMNFHYKFAYNLKCQIPINEFWRLSWFYLFEKILDMSGRIIHKILPSLSLSELLLNLSQKMLKSWKLMFSDSYFLQDDQEPLDNQFFVDGGYYPRIFFLSKFKTFEKSPRIFFLSKFKTFKLPLSVTPSHQHSVATLENEP